MEVGIDRSIAKCFLNDAAMDSGDSVALRIFSTYKQAVIQREANLLTKKELQQHADLAAAAILEELHVWNNHTCFRRRLRSQCHNIMDSRFVAKWKIVIEKGIRKKLLRMRMTLRGFKDLEADRLVKYAATASRQSQRLISSEAACHDNWIIISIDVNKAFLKGLTYDELAKLTGEPRRHVAFTLPKGAAEQLRKIPGYEDFDEQWEVLECIKPGTGCVDAPRAFSLKLAQVTQSPELGLKPTTFDGQLELQHNGHELTAIVGKHVDDVKIAGLKSKVLEIVDAIEKVFGKVSNSIKDGNCEDFTNCGVRHTVMPNGDVVADQDEYIKDLRPIAHGDLTGRRSHEECTYELQSLFWSLLGGVAYTLLTQVWISCFIIALQRVTHKPTILHVKRLNVIVRAIQAQPQRIRYRRMVCGRHLEVHADSAFSKEDSKGYALKGTNVMRRGVERHSGEQVWHLLEGTAQSHKNVVRSTFGAELFAITSAADSLIPLLVTVEELAHGTLSIAQAKRLREEGGWCFKSVLVTDSMSLFQAIHAHKVKIPSEKSLALHLFWLRELLSRQILNELKWCDTRDMTADGHTKGSVDRQALLKFMNGIFQYSHAVQSTGSQLGRKTPSKK